MKVLAVPEVLQVGLYLPLHEGELWCSRSARLFVSRLTSSSDGELRIWRLR